MDKNYLTVLILIGSIFLCLIFFVFNQSIILELLIIGALVALFIITGKRFISTNTSLSNIFGDTSTISITVDPNADINNSSIPPPTITSSEPKSSSAYFIPGQYTYSDSVDVCKKDGATLANIGQIYDAYNKGKEWCQYGWSDEMMILYPTQQTTWEKLKTEGKDRECGRPGVNGGYTDKLNTKLGVNCYK
jgi:hypothetical protein